MTVTMEHPTITITINTIRPRCIRGGVLLVVAEEEPPAAAAANLAVIVIVALTIQLSFIPLVRSFIP